MSGYPIKVVRSVSVTDAILSSTNVPESDYPAYSVGSTYALGARAYIDHLVYQSLQEGNTGNAPASGAPWWVLVGPTSRWAPFDLSTSTEAVLPANAYYEFAPGQAVNAVYLTKYDGITSVRARLTDPNVGVVYDTTKSLAMLPSESTWYAWTFEPRLNPDAQAVLTDLPSYPPATLRIDFENIAGAVLGVLAFGDAKSIGMGAQYGLRMGITDYSRKERDEWGNTVLVQRAYSRRITLETSIAADEVDNAFENMASLRATPCLAILSDQYRTLRVFGFFASFEITISYATFSLCSIEFESLT